MHSSLLLSYLREGNPAFCPFYSYMQEEGTLHSVSSTLPTLISKRREPCILSLPLSNPRGGNPAFCTFHSAFQAEGAFSPFHSPIQEKGTLNSVPSILLFKRREPCILSLLISYLRTRNHAFCPFNSHIQEEENLHSVLSKRREHSVHSPLLSKIKEPCILSLSFSYLTEGDPAFCPSQSSIQQEGMLQLFISFQEKVILLLSSALGINPASVPLQQKGILHSVNHFT
jgi:hypothetical protein